MSAIIREMGEMTDSRELLEAKPHPIVAWFLMILFLLLAGGLMWSWYGEMDITVKANGLVRPNEKVSMVKNMLGGKVAQVHYQAGQHVKKGDLLYTLERDAADQDLQAAQSELARVKADQSSLLSFKQDLTQGSVDLSLDQLNGQMLKQGGAAQSLQMQRAGVLKQIGDLQDKLGQLTLLEQSVLQGKNLFPDASSVYASQYADYEIKRRKLEQDKAKVIDDFKASLGEGNLTTAKRPFENIQISTDQLRNDLLLQVRTEIAEDKDKLDVLKLSESKVYADLNASLKDDEDKIASLGDKIESIQLGLNDYEVKAPADGTVQMVKDITPGELLQPGDEIVSIVPENGSQFIIELTLPNRDVADIRPGERIKYHFQALPYKDYGELTGHVRTISPDAVAGPDGTGSFYLVEADIDNKPLFNRKGEPGSIRVGMSCEAYTITKSQKILYYLMEKLDLRG